MARKCINSCDRLAMAVTYLIVGILQLSAGLVLIKSKYVSLLSAPNFWTAASNLSVAGLIAASVSVWKNVDKKTATHCVRRNLIASLVFSAMIINGVTFAILFLDESHTLLSIHLEDKSVFTSKHFMSEVLGYGYAASLWMPIICIAISSCFLLRLYCKRKETVLQTSNEHKLTKTPEEYEWVFKSKNPPMPDPEIMRKAVKNRVSSSSDSSDWSVDDVLPIRSFTLASTAELGNSQHRNLSSDRSLSIPRISWTLESHLKSNTKNKVSFADDTLSIKSRRNKFNPQTKHVSLKKLQQIMKPDGTFQLSDLQNFKKPRVDLTSCKTEMFTRIEDIRQTSMDHTASESRTRGQDIAHLAEIHADGSSFQPDLSDDIFENFSRDLLFSPYPKVRRTSTTKSLKCISENEHKREDESFHYSSSGDECPDNKNNSNLSLNEMNHSAPGDETLSEERMHGNVFRVRVNSVFDTSPSKTVPVMEPQVPEISSHEIVVSKNLNENTVYKDPDSTNFPLRNVNFSSFKADGKIRRKSKLRTNVTNASYEHNGSQDLQHFSKVKEELLDVILKTDLSQESEPSILKNNLSHRTSGYVSSLEDRLLNESNKNVLMQKSRNPAAS